MRRAKGEVSTAVGLSFLQAVKIIRSTINILYFVCFIVNKFKNSDSISLNILPAFVKELT